MDAGGGKPSHFAHSLFGNRGYMPVDAADAVDRPLLDPEAAFASAAPHQAVRMEDLAESDNESDRHDSPHRPSLLRMRSIGLGRDARLDELGNVEINDEEVDDELPLLDAYYDITPQRLEMLFSNFDHDMDGLLSASELRDGLRTLGIGYDDGDYERIKRQYFPSEQLNFEDFQIVIQKLKLEAMFEPATAATLLEGVERANLVITDYSPNRLKRLRLVSDRDHQAFFMLHRNPWVHMRWIDVEGMEPLTLKRLAIKYRLHPLAVEDALSLESRPKVEIYDSHLFLVVPVLSWYSDPDDPDLPRVNGSQVSVFVLGYQDGSPEHTIITVQEDYDRDIWRPLNQRLATPYSKLRHYRGAFLLYSILDVLVDRFIPLVERFGQQVQEMETRLMADVTQAPDPSYIHRLLKLRREIRFLSRLVRPIHDVVKIVIKTDVIPLPKGTELYLRDVLDHVLQVMENLTAQMELCKSLSDEYNNQRGNQMNEVMYVLTVVTAVFIPAQFISGVYGMNFTHMPEITWPYSYAVFWGVVVTVSASMLMYFRKVKGWL